MNRVILNVASVLLFAFLFSFTARAQEDKTKRPSPPDSAMGTVAGAHITIKYSSPAVKGRKIWGGLVPYDSVWRAGANEATTFETDRNIKVQGQDLPAGKYGLFAIPGESSWTIVFNKVPNQWGAFKYDMSKDQLRVTTTPKKSATMNERLKYRINSNGFSLLWENLEVPVMIQ
jgi:hypothetical protein